MVLTMELIEGRKAVKNRPISENKNLEGKTLQWWNDNHTALSAKQKTAVADKADPALAQHLVETGTANVAFRALQNTLELTEKGMQNLQKITKNWTTAKVTQRTAESHFQNSTVIFQRIPADKVEEWFEKYNLSVLAPSGHRSAPVLKELEMIAVHQWEHCSLRGVERIDHIADHLVSWTRVFPHVIWENEIVVHNIGVAEDETVGDVDSPSAIAVSIYRAYALRVESGELESYKMVPTPSDYRGYHGYGNVFSYSTDLKCVREAQEGHYAKRLVNGGSERMFHRGALAASMEYVFNMDKLDDLKFRNESGSATLREVGWNRLVRDQGGVCAALRFVQELQEKHLFAISATIDEMKMLAQYINSNKETYTLENVVFTKSTADRAEDFLQLMHDAGLGSNTLYSMFGGFYYRTPVNYISPLSDNEIRVADPMGAVKTFLLTPGKHTDAPFLSPTFWEDLQEYIGGLNGTDGEAETMALFANYVSEYGTVRGSRNNNIAYPDDLDRGHTRWYYTYTESCSRMLGKAFRNYDNLPKSVQVNLLQNLSSAYTPTVLAFWNLMAGHVRLEDSKAALQMMIDNNVNIPLPAMAYVGPALLDMGASSEEIDSLYQSCSTAKDLVDLLEMQSM